MINGKEWHDLKDLADSWDKAAALPWDGLGSFDREDAQNDVLRACAYALRAILDV